MVQTLSCGQHGAAIQMLQVNSLSWLSLQAGSIAHQGRVMVISIIMRATLAAAILMTGRIKSKHEIGTKVKNDKNTASLASEKNLN